MSIKSVILAETNSDMRKFLIEQKLNKLFYCPTKMDEEIKFLQIKRGNEGDRIGLHASSIITSDNEFCYREQVLSLFYKQLQGKNIQIGLKRIFAEGDAIHEKWQRLFIRGNIGTPEDMDRTRFNKKYDLSFSPDAIVTINKKQYIVEIKSQNTFIYKKQNSHPSGMKQLKFYMLLTGIENGFVLVEDKNSQEFKVLIADYKTSEMDKYKERLIKIQEYKQKFLELRKVPKRICSSCNIKRVETCNMSECCWNKGEGRIKLKN